jgi:hypothetical protein
MWRLGGDIHAPSARSMRQLCWECRERAAAPLAAESPAESPAGDRTDTIMAQVNAIVREYEAGNV